MSQRWRPDPVIFVIVALLCAAALVVYLQDRSLRALDRQTSALVQKVAEQTVTSAAHEVRRIFDGPVFDTIASVNHPYLVDQRLDLVALQFARGLVAYPQVERFVVWTGSDVDARDADVLFFGDRSLTPERISTASDAAALFSRSATLGRHVLDAARIPGRTQKIYASTRVTVDEVPYEVFVRVLYTDAARQHFFAILGFVVNIDTLRTTLFPSLFERQLASLLEPRDGSPSFHLRVHDDRGAQVFGPAEAPVAHMAATTGVAMQFYPADDIRTRMAVGVQAPSWTLTVSPREAQASALLASTRRQSRWLSGASVALMLLALGFAVQGSRRATQLARMQAEFVAHVSHQLKTPVSLLSAASETLGLDRVRSPEKLSQFLGIVRVEVGHLSSLVARILEFSRVSDGGRRYEIEAVPLVVLVTETVETFARAVAPVGYRIEVEPTDARPIVAADPMALEQALVNLLDNAAKYSGDARDIQVRMRVTASEAMVDVVDHGIGIAPGERANVFDRFYRGAGASLHRQGFGLGLALVRELLNGQHGSVEVLESEPGRGSTFRLRVPVLRAPSRRSGAWRLGSGWFGRRQRKAKEAL